MCEECGAHGTAVPVAAGGVRVVVVGKGGVGKSTLTALLARTVARSGRRVVAVDADEQRNLGACLGLDRAALAAATPVAASAEYVEEKTGARPGSGAGAMLRLNPDTADVVDRLAVPAPDGVRLLVMGGVRRAGGGCLCPENTVLAAVIAGLRLRQQEVVVMDTHAGVEHFGRALARGFDRAAVVVDPTANAVQVGLETATLARQLGIGDVHLVVNRAHGPRDLDRTRALVADAGGFAFTDTHVLPYDRSLLDGEPSVAAALGAGAVRPAVEHLARHLFAPAPAARGATG